MSIDLEALAAAATRAGIEASARLPTGVAGLVANLHRNPSLEFVTIESIALLPVPVEHEGRRAVAALIASPAGPGRWRPWGRVIWSCPSGDVLVAERLDEAAVPIAFEPISEDYREICVVLDSWLEVSHPAEAESLSALYGRLLDPDTLARILELLPSAKGVLDG